MKKKETMEENSSINKRPKSNLRQTSGLIRKSCGTLRVRSMSVTIFIPRNLPYSIYLYIINMQNIRGRYTIRLLWSSYLITVGVRDKDAVSRFIINMDNVQRRKIHKFGVGIESTPSSRSHAKLFNNGMQNFVKSLPVLCQQSYNQVIKQL